MKKLFSIGVLILIVLIGVVMSGCERAKVPKEPTHTQTECGNFRLTISVDSTSFRRGRDIEVTIVFENLSGERQEVMHGAQITYLYVVNSKHYPGVVTRPRGFSVLEKDEVVTTTEALGGSLPRGKHELVAIASFGFGNQETYPRPLPENDINVVSNTIILTVK